MNKTDIFSRLRMGEPVDMLDTSYMPAVEHMDVTRKLCQRINQAEPDFESLRPLFEQMLNAPLPDRTYVMPPLQIDFGCQMQIGRNVFINHGLCCMSAGGITIDDDVQIGPRVAMITTNHDFSNRRTLRCKGIRICRNAWIGACAVILPGVTVGENAIVAAGAVVTKNVEPNTIVGGNPARIIRRIE